MRIRELRQEFGYTQEELGRKIGQTKSNVSKYETGALEPGIDTLKTLSIIFNVSLDYLLGKSNTRNPEQANKPIEKPNPLLEKIENLSPESIEELEKYMELLKLKEQMDKCKDETSSALKNEA